MKKNVILVAVAIAIVAVVALVLVLKPGNTQKQLGNNPSTNNGENTQEPSIEHTGKKIEGQITSASVFSEGLAFVCVDRNKEKGYCINKQGYIVFEIEMDIHSPMGQIYTQFENGMAFFNSTNGAVCNTKGEITYPNDVGATDFYGFALNGGYIVATKITADYSTAKKELGIMNTKFEWVLQPSEQLYNELSKNLWTSNATNTQSFYANGFLYFDGCKKYLNVSTGEVSESIDVRLPSDTWQYYTDNTFRDTDKNIIVSLSHLDNIEGTKYNAYKNGKVPVFFYNREAAKRFWTLVDENGAFLFEPAELEGFSTLSALSKVMFDGEYTVCFNDSYNKLISYNSKGELIGELTFDVATGDINDGVIVLVTGGMNAKKCYYYNADLTPLFGE